MEPNPDLVFLPVFDAFLLTRRLDTALRLFNANSSKLYSHLYEISVNLANPEVESNIQDTDRKFIVDSLNLLLSHMWAGVSAYIIHATLDHLYDLVSKIDEMHVFEDDVLLQMGQC